MRSDPVRGHLSRGYGWLFQKASDPIVGPQQCLHFVAQILVAGACVFQKRSALWDGNLERLSKNDYFAARLTLHGVVELFCRSS